MARFVFAGFLLLFGAFASFPAFAQTPQTQNDNGFIAAENARVSGGVCRERFVEGFDLEAELESLERPEIGNVLKVLSGFLYLDAYIIDCDAAAQQRLDDDRQPTVVPQQPPRKCFSTPDGQTICYTIKGPGEMEVEYCDENGNCKKIIIKKNDDDGTITISNPNATIEMECTLDPQGRTQCKVKSVKVTGGWLTKRLYNDLIDMIESITTSSNPNNNTLELCLTKDNGDEVCYTVTPTNIEMCVEKPDGSLECVGREPGDDVTDLIDWME